MSRATRGLCLAWMLASLTGPLATHAGDWPQWRYDAQRSAASPDRLPAGLRLTWTRSLPRLKPAWPDQPKMQLDVVYEPIVVGQRLFIGSSFDDSVTAYDTRTGNEVWRYFANGPVRFAPLAWKDKLYFASDDGHVYCLRSDSGEFVWRFRGGPSDQKVLGNERLISTWPARGAPVIADGTLYFAAGIWPFMGIFLHALDAETGAVRWTNDGDGSQYIKQPHNSDSFAGVAPQGPLVVHGQKLLVPGGRSVPACYDRATGQMRYYQLADNGKRGGGSAVSAVDKLLFNGGAGFDVETGKYLGEVGDLLAFADGRLFASGNRELHSLDLASAGTKTSDVVDRTGVVSKVTKWSMNTAAVLETPQLTSLIKAGERLYCGSPGRLLAYPLTLDVAPGSAWEVEIEGTPLSLVAADDRLFAVTQEGRLYCFAAGADAPVSRFEAGTMATVPDGNRGASDAAQAMLKAGGVHAGYALILGAGHGDPILELARQSSLRMVVIEQDAMIVLALRNKLRAAGVGCDRVAVLEADPLGVSLPPYFASLIVAPMLPANEDARTALVAKLFASLRPFGGVAVFTMQADVAKSLAVRLKDRLTGAAWKTVGEVSLLVREGALPDSANWTHEHADAANTRVSQDKLVKAPLGLLWFGGSSNEAILPRHGHGPQPQVVDGRLFIEGVDLLRATDIYTGRILWEAKLPGLGNLYDNTAHQPGANASGTNYVATPDGIYVALGSECLKLNPATGRQMASYRLPPVPGANAAPLWGYLNVVDDYLVGGGDPVFDASFLRASSKRPPVASDDDGFKSKTVPPVKPVGPAKPVESGKVAEPAKPVEPADKAVKSENDNYSSSNRLVVFDRRSGKVIWTATARSGFRHNAICIGGGRMYCIDRLSGAQMSRLKRRGETPRFAPRLVVFDMSSGDEIWSTETDVFGTWLSYSVERDVLVESGRTARDTLSDEPKGMRAYRGNSGSVLWTDRTLDGPAMIHHDTILLAGSACELLTGAKRMREHPLTGESVEWTWSRNYGCNTPVASEHLLTFRSGAAGYFDFCNDGGTGNLGGFRSSCTNNLIVAGGVLSAPDYTRTCTCRYQNQTSLALVHMPEVETWTSFGALTPKQPIRRLGINLGAPGDRKSDNGTLWLEYPSAGGSSPSLTVKISPEKPAWFRRHSSQIDGPGLPWVAASGAQGLTSFDIKLGDADSPARRYTVRLHFAEPDDVQPGQRVFDVLLQGERVATDLDVVKEAGGRHRSLVKEFVGQMVAEELEIDFAPRAAAKTPRSILCGVEIVAEGW